MSQVWLITGSSRGLGRTITEAALEAGHKVVATARNPTSLSSLLTQYPNLKSYSLDVTDPVAAQNAVQFAVATFGRLDVLVNNAGYGDVGSIEDTPLEEIRAQIETNLFGVINVTKAAIPIMREQRSGHIVQVSSIGGRIGPAGRGAYSAAKWGVEGFSEVLSKEIGPLGVKVTIVEPGAFRTDFAGISTMIREGRNEYKDTVGRMAEYQRDHDGEQIGDPKKAAAVIIYVAGLEEPPLRLLLGSDAYNAAEKNDLVKMEADRKWRHVSLSTDFNDVSSKVSSAREKGVGEGSSA